MNKYLFAAILLITCVYACTLTEIPDFDNTPGQNIITFSKSYMDAGSANDFIETSNNQFAIVGNTSEGSSLFMTDAEGNALANMPIIFNHTSHVHAIIETSDGNFALIGNTRGASVPKMSLILTDSNGEELSGSPFVFDISDAAYTGKDIVQIPNGNFGIIGTERENSDTDLCLIIAEQNGTLIRNITFDSGNGSDGVGGIINSASGLIITGTAATADGRSNLWTILTDRFGSVIPNFVKEFDHGGIYGTNDLIQLANGELAIVGSMTEVLSGWSAFLTILDQSTVEKSGFPKFFRGEMGASRGSGVVQHTNGNLAFTGTSDQGIPLFLLNADGTLINDSPKYISESGFTRASTIITTKDGGFAMISSNSTLEKLLLLKTNVNGEIK